MAAALRIRKSTGRQLAGQKHDQLIYVVPAHEAVDFHRLLLAEMRQPLEWCMDLPLDAEGGYGYTLKEAGIPKPEK